MKYVLFLVGVLVFALGTTVGWGASAMSRTEPAALAATPQVSLKPGLSTADQRLKSAVAFGLDKRHEIVGQPGTQQEVFKLSYTNTSDRVIVGMRGTLTLYDVFGGVISALPVRWDSKVAPGEVATQDMRYNSGSPIYTRTVDIAPERLAWEFRPEQIVYDDGTQLAAR